KNPEELLPASPADRGSGIRLIKSEDRKKDDIINRPGRSTYPREKSVLTSGATCPRHLDAAHPCAFHSGATWCNCPGDDAAPVPVLKPKRQNPGPRTTSGGTGRR